MYLCVSTFSNISSENHWADWSQISCEASLEWGNESLFKRSRSHDPRWPQCPYMVKTLKNLLLGNQKAYDLETWYAALSAGVLLNLFKWWPWVDRDLFYGKVKFGPLCKGKTMDISETIVVCDTKVGRCSQLNEYMVKTWKILLWNQKADDLESLYAASGPLVLPSLFKWWPWVDLDLFYSKVKFGPLCFCMGIS